jgi:hypothetical protein
MDNMNLRDHSYHDVAWLNDTDIPLLIEHPPLPEKHPLPLPVPRPLPDKNVIVTSVH